MTAAVSICSLLAPERITPAIQAVKRTAAIHEVARLLQDHPQMLNFQGFYNDLLVRDRLDTTCVGNGIALPHARTDHVGKLVLALGISREGILFENTSQRIHLIFVIGTPKSQAADYLATVSSICRMLRDDGNRQRLLEASDATGAWNLLKEFGGA